MKRTALTIATFILSFCASGVSAEHQYITFDENENMVVSGPFEAVIPKPANARIGGPENSSPSFMNEELKVSKAGYFGDDQMVIVNVETTNAAAGTLTNENLPVYKIAGEEFRARTACIDISQAELDMDDDPFFEFIEDQNVQLVPAVQAVQLSVVTDDGTGEGTILYLRNVPGGCDSVSAEFMAEFEGAFGRFIESIRGTD
jgi:hypothetical protein